MLRECAHGGYDQIAPRIGRVRFDVRSQNGVHLILSAKQRAGEVAFGNPSRRSFAAGCGNTPGEDLAKFAINSSTSCRLSRNAAEPQLFKDGAAARAQRESLCNSPGCSLVLNDGNDLRSVVGSPRNEVLPLGRRNGE